MRILRTHIHIQGMMCLRMIYLPQCVQAELHYLHSRTSLLYLITFDVWCIQSKKGHLKSAHFPSQQSFHFQVYLNVTSSTTQFVNSVYCPITSYFKARLWVNMNVLLLCKYIFMYGITYSRIPLRANKVRATMFLKWRKGLTWGLIVVTNKYFGQRMRIVWWECFCFSPDSVSPLGYYLWVDHLVDSTDPSLK